MCCVCPLRSLMELLSFSEQVLFMIHIYRLEAWISVSTINRCCYLLYCQMYVRPYRCALTLPAVFPIQLQTLADSVWQSLRVCECNTGSCQWCRLGAVLAAYWRALMHKRSGECIFGCGPCQWIVTIRMEQTTCTCCEDMSVPSGLAWSGTISETRLAPTSNERYHVLSATVTVVAARDSQH